MKRSIEHVPPRLAKKFFSSVLWEGSPESGTLALTFDDGPDPDVTPDVLDTLAEVNGRATFFCVGDNAASHPDVLRSIADKGHLIGSHSMSHKRMLFMNREEVRSEIENAERVIAEITGSTPLLFRPPYGMFDFCCMREVRDRGLRMVLWTVLSGDYSSDSRETILKRVLPFIRPGVIIVFHDTSSGGGENLPELIRKIAAIARKKSIRLGTIDDFLSTGKERAGDSE